MTVPARVSLLTLGVADVPVHLPDRRLRAVTPPCRTPGRLLGLAPYTRLNAVLNVNGLV